jgi:hypothetical protein
MYMRRQLNKEIIQFIIMMNNRKKITIQWVLLRDQVRGNQLVQEKMIRLEISIVDLMRLKNRS